MFTSKGLQTPTQVTGLSLSKAWSGTPALTVAWTAPESDASLSQYKVQYRINGTTIFENEFTVSGSPPQAFALLTGLDAGTEYNVRVRAVSAVGDGMWSAVQTERTYRSKSCNDFVFLIST